MSLYRSIFVIVAAFCVATSVFAADEAKTTATKAAQTIAAAPQGKININKATADELAKVEGLSASKARAMVSYRTKHGDFKSLDDLKAVKGFKRFSEKKMKALEEKLTIG